jgi:predicted DNA-binding transcriptional regulator AlpA
MPSTLTAPAVRFAENTAAQPTAPHAIDPSERKPPARSFESSYRDGEPLLTVDDVARRLNVSKDWVWDHSSRKAPRLPVIRMGDGTLRYRPSGIEAFISERERISALRISRR